MALRRSVRKLSSLSTFGTALAAMPTWPAPCQRPVRCLRALSASSRTHLQRTHSLQCSATARQSRLHSSARLRVSHLATAARTLTPASKSWSNLRAPPLRLLALPQVKLSYQAQALHKQPSWSEDRPTQRMRLQAAVALLSSMEPLCIRLARQLRLMAQPSACRHQG